MKKVINGKQYNTETAKCIGSIEPAGYNVNDFNYWRERLYRTKAGAYFIYGEGGGNSRYGEWHGNTGGWGEEIRPMAFTEAQEWAEENLDGDDYGKAFGNPEEAGDNRGSMLLSLSATTRAKIQRAADASGKNMGQIIDELVEQYL